VILCDYKTDLGGITRLVRPRSQGVNTNTNEDISPSEILTIISNYVPITGYYERFGRTAVCSFNGRKRRLLLQLNNQVIDVEYPEPFINFDWTVFDDLSVKAETVPEFINDAQIRQYLKDFS